MIDIHQNKFISLFLTPFIGLEVLTFSGMICARKLTVCHIELIHFLSDAEDNDAVIRGASWSGVMEVRQTSQFGSKGPTHPLFLGLALQSLPPPYFR